MDDCSNSTQGVKEEMSTIVALAGIMEENMGLNVELTSNKDKLQKQIAALEWQLTQDTRGEDKKIHQYALERMKSQLIKF